MKDSTFDKYCLVVDEYLVNGMNGTAAYLKFYPNVSSESAEASFRKILGNTRIKNYVNSKQSKLSETLHKTAESQVKELDRIKKMALGDDKYSDAINALKEQNKLLGLYEEDNKQKSITVNIPVTNWINGSEKGAEDMDNFNPESD